VEGLGSGLLPPAFAGVAMTWDGSVGSRRGKGARCGYAASPGMTGLKGGGLGAPDWVVVRFGSGLLPPAFAGVAMTCGTDHRWVTR
jgi:hypothetical protein